MYFASDNAGRVHPEIMTALNSANEGYAMPYGADPIMGRLTEQLRDIFEAPDAAVYLVATGTAANSLGLASLMQPWQTIFCSPVSHIHEDECNAPEFFTGGAKLTLVPGDHKLEADDLRATIEGEETRGVHGPQRGPVAITQVTERGGVYALDHLMSLTAVAREFKLPVHLDGARFANALVTQNITAAQMTWRAGVDVVSFGATKNGAMGVEAVILFDPERSWEFELRRKRGAHLFSKHRYLSAQMAGYLKDDLWLRSARAANDAATELADGLRARGADFLHEPEANMIFATFPRAVHQKLHDAGAQYYIWSGTLEGDDPDEMLAARLVCDWSVTEDAIRQFLSYF